MLEQRGSLQKWVSHRCPGLHPVLSESLRRLSVHPPPLPSPPQAPGRGAQEAVGVRGIPD